MIPALSIGMKIRMNERAREWGNLELRQFIGEEFIVRQGRADRFRLEAVDPGMQQVYCMLSPPRGYDTWGDTDTNRKGFDVVTSG